MIKIIYKVGRWKLSLAIIFTILLLALHTCLYPDVFSMTVTVFLDDSDSVAVVSDVKWSPKLEYIGKRKLVFSIENDWISLKGCTEAIRHGLSYTTEQVQHDRQSVNVTADPTYLTASIIQSALHVTLPDDEQARRHYHDDKPPRIIPPNIRREKLHLQFIVS